MFAFVFDSVSGGEWLVLLAVILIIVGPKNLPSAARKMGEIMSKLRRAADEFKRQLMTMDEEMKRTADDIKKEYIDIPDDSSSRDITEISGGASDYSPDGPDYGDYPDAYHEEDYYGSMADEASGEVSPDAGPGMAESGPASVAASESGTAGAADPAGAGVPDTETAEKANG